MPRTVTGVLGSSSDRRRSLLRRAWLQEMGDERLFDTFKGMTV
jgi:hypothetical protein